MVINKIKTNPKMRLTPQKIAIINYLKSVRTHPTAEQVYKAIKKNISTITLATVYRNLNTLAEQKHILRLEINHEYHYDYHTETHQHFVCEDSGKIYDIEDSEMTKLIEKRLNKKFKPNSISVIIKGTYEV